MLDTRNAHINWMLGDLNTYATVLVAIAIDQYGADCFEWEPETLRHSLERDFGKQMPSENVDKLNALMLALSTNLFYVSVEAFINICNALDGAGANFQVYDPADVDEMEWALTEVMMNDDQKNPAGEGQLFSQEIRQYMGAQAREEGFLRLPQPLSKFGAAPGVEDLHADEDASMFAASWAGKQEQIKDAERKVAVRQRELLTQLDKLPLLHRDVESWQSFVGKVQRGSGRSK